MCKNILEMDIGPVKGRQYKSLHAKSKRKNLCQINEKTNFGAMCLVYWYLLSSLWYKFKLERGKLFLFFIQSLVFLCWRLSSSGLVTCFFLHVLLFLVLFFFLFSLILSTVMDFHISTFVVDTLEASWGIFKRHIPLFWGYAKYIFMQLNGK